MYQRKRPGKSKTAIYRREMSKLKQFALAFPKRPPIPYNLWDNSFQEQPLVSGNLLTTQKHDDTVFLDVNLDESITNHTNANINSLRNSVDIDNDGDSDEDNDSMNVGVDIDAFDYDTMDNNINYLNIGMKMARDKNHPGTNINHDNFDESVNINCNESSSDTDDSSRCSDNDNGGNGSDYDDDDNDCSFFEINHELGFKFPLISKNHISAKDHLLSIIAISVKHRMSYEAISDIFRWIKSSHSSNYLPTSKASLWKVLSRKNSIITLHYYCKFCKDYLGPKNESKLLQTQYSCKRCGPKQLENYLGYYLSLSLRAQIKQLLNIPNITQALKYRFLREKRKVDSLEDIYDGQEYQRLCAPGNILSCWHNFSITFNTDGYQVAHSSRTSAWPVYAEINELSPHLRKKYMMLAAIYVDNEHPLMNNLLRPFTIEMRNLFNVGITWTPTNSAPVTSKFIVIVGHGIKGYSALTAVPMFNMSKGIIVEAMHAVFLGVTKLHTTILLTTTKTPYYIGNPKKLQVIDEYLLTIRPPSCRSRHPRSIKYYAQWKASEWRNWLDYAPICLNNVLSKPYGDHLALLSEAIHNLNCDSVTSTQLNRAETLLKNHVIQFEILFGTTKMTSNIHLMTHLVQCVRDWGPISAHHAFVFESWNRKILDTLTSPNARQDQIATRFLIYKFINNSFFDENISSETRNFIKKKLNVIDETYETKNRNKFIGKGKLTTRKLSVNERNILQEAGFNPEVITSFQSMQVNGVKFACENPEKTTRFSDSFIHNDVDNTFSSIQSIVQFNQDSITICGIIVKNFQHINYGFDTRHIHRLMPLSTTNFIRETRTIRPAIKICPENVVYGVKLANCWETD